MTWRGRHFGVTQHFTSRITAFASPHHFRDEMQKGAFRSFGGEALPEPLSRSTPARSRQRHSRRPASQNALRRILLFMQQLANIAVLVVALLHLGFLVLEMFLWTKPFGRRTFGLSRELAEATKGLAANQGLYNGFLAAGLIWGVIAGDAGFPIKVFFLACVIIAGIFGAITAKRSILFVQALPGMIALIAVWIAR